MNLEIGKRNCFAENVKRKSFHKLIVLLARLVNLLHDADEDAEHHQDYHICAEIVSCSVVRCAIYFCFGRRFLAVFFFVQLPHFVDFLELVFNFGHQVGEKFSKIKKKNGN